MSYRLKDSFVISGALRNYRMAKNKCPYSELRSVPMVNIGQTRGLLTP